MDHDDAAPRTRTPEDRVLEARDALPRRRSAGPAPTGTSFLRRNARVLVPLALFAAALTLLVFRLGSPAGEIPLDERHYVPDAADVIDYGTESDVRSESAFVVHPPAGKWMIAAGMAVFGRDSAFGWRAGAALFGALGVLLMYLLGRRLWPDRRWPPILAAALLGLDGLWFVQSRVAMLDIYVATFALAAVWLLVEDRARSGPGHRGLRPFRIAAGVAAGLALASKWSALPAFGVLVLFGLWWEAARLRDAGRITDGAATIRAMAATAGALALLPLGIYVASYAPWFADGQRYLPPRCEAIDNRLSGWICYQREIYDFHKNLEKFEDGKPKHPYFSEVWSWPWIGRPVVHAYTTAGEGADQTDAEVVGLPNPVVWVPAWIAIVPLGIWALRRRPGAPRGPDQDEAWARPEPEAGPIPEPPPPAPLGERDGVAALILAFVAANYLPYLVTGFFGRPAFLFYATPLVPFLVLGLVHAFARASERRSERVVRRAVAGYALLAALMFAYFYPVLASAHIPHEGGPFSWRGHMWLSSDCSSEDIKLFCWI